MFAKLDGDFQGRSAGSITPEEAQAWLKGLVNENRSGRTVKNTWVKAMNTVFRWGVDQKHIGRNPFTDAGRVLTAPKKRTNRETKAFRVDERTTILRAALAVKDTTKSFDAARRWVPWLCSYTGARPGEITQLRASDVINRDGIHALNLTPEAGTVKGGIAPCGLPCDVAAPVSAMRCSCRHDRSSQAPPVNTCALAVVSIGLAHQQSSRVVSAT